MNTQRRGQFRIRVTGAGRLTSALAALFVTVATVAVVPARAEAAAESVKLMQAQRYAPVPQRPAPATKAVRHPADTAAAAAKVVQPAPQWPAAGTAEVVLPATAAPKTRAGALPVLIGAAKADPRHAGTRVRVTTMAHTDAAKAGIDGLLLRVSTPQQSAARPLTVSVDYQSFATAFGADWSNRLRLVALPDCALATAGAANCAGMPLTTRHDRAAGMVSADLNAVTAAGSLVALTTGPSSGAGTYTATDLAPSSTWGHSGSTGGFTWSYPMQMPPTAGGPVPSVALSYSSQSVDGRSAASNNQPGPIGEGFDLSQGYVERRYKACSDEMGGAGANNTVKTGDLCWGTSNAVLSLGGRSAELLLGSDGKWHPKEDDGSKIELIKDTSFANGDKDGEYWKVTTAAGIQYWFGRHRLPGWTAGRPVTNSVWTVPVFGNNSNEPCHQATYTASSCPQGWRWNLDYVVDLSGNTMSLWYGKETNKYALNAKATAPVDYDRGGYLTRIDYGTDNRDGTEYTSTAPYTSAPQQVEFTPSDRCKASCATHNETTWPDTPWDLDCTVAPKATNCLQGVPTFWTTQRVTAITTKVSGQPVDSWTMDQDFPDPGDGTRAGLWLKSITHRGLDGPAADAVIYPQVTFSGIQMNNRVDSSGSDWALAMNWWRVNSIRNETGGETFVSYSPRECVAKTKVPAAADNNSLLCFPVKWTPPGYSEVTDYYHKYVVTDVQQVDHTGGSKPVLTHYDYLNPDKLPLWHRDDDDGLVPEATKSWAQWRGYPTVVTTTGAAGEQTRTETLYYRGMHGDQLADGTTRTVTVAGRDGGAVTDWDAFAGSPREQITWNGAKVEKGTVTDMWQSDASATRGTVTSRYTAPATTRTRIALDNGTWQRTKTVTSYDAYGMPTKTADLGDESTATDDQCVATDYARNTTAPKWLLTPVKRTHSWVGACDNEPTAAAQIISDTRFSFDTLGYGATPTRGLVTATDSIKGVIDFTPQYQPISTAKYDPQGRITDATDITGANTHTDYTPVAGGPTTKTVVTNPLGWTTTTEFNPARSLPTMVTDPNGRITEVVYDNAGRTKSVWLPGHTSASYPSVPSSTFAYALSRADGVPSVVTSTTLDANGKPKATYSLYDGFARARQTQTPAYGGGRIVADTFYDSAGRTYLQYNAHAVAGTAGPGIVYGLRDDMPQQVQTVFDAVGRPTASILRSKVTEKWRTTTSYHGDHVDETPPLGGTPTSTWTDARGRTVATRQFHGPTPTGSYDETKLTYNPAGSLVEVADASGNTWTYEYDIRGRMTRTTDPDHGESITKYDQYDRIEYVDDARHKRVAYTYDALSRRMTVRDGSTDGNIRAQWAYDSPAKGLTASSSRFSGGQEYKDELITVDAEYRPTQTRTTIPTAEGALAGPYSTRYSYRADGSPNTIILPAAGGLAGETLTYDYDANYATPVALKTNYAGATYYVNQATYTELYEPSTVARSTQLTGAGFVQTSQHYDEATGRVDLRKTIRSVGTANLTNAEVEYDAAGNILKIDDNAAGGRDTQCFDYDSRRRLTEAWTPASSDCGAAPTTAGLGGPAPYWQSYDFGAADDPSGRVGNRLKQIDHTAAGNITTDYSYPAAKAAQPHALTSVTRTDGNGTATSGYTYDEAGQTKTRPGPHGQQTLTWDAEGKMTGLSDEAGTNTYIYDADGNRLVARDPTGTTVDLGATQLRLPKNATQALATRYYTFNGEVIGQRDATGLRWLAADHQGTNQVSVTADAQQTLTQRRQTPFGETRGTPTTWVNPKGFVGGDNDPTGLTHVGARDYDPGTGRFLSVDPLQDLNSPQQWNAYAYANNNPSTFSDPDGLRTDDKYYGPDNADRKNDPNKDTSGGGHHHNPPAGTDNGNNSNGDGPSDADIDKANQITHKSTLDVIIEAGGNILMEFFGINDVLNCVQNGDLGACGMALVGALPVGKALKALKTLPVVVRAGKAIAAFFKERKWAETVLRGLGRCLDHSFSPDTRVLMADSSRKKLKDIKLGDKVLATDPTTGKTTSKTVTTLYSHEDTELAAVTVATSKGSSRTLKTTQNHPFWDDTTSSWVEAKQLQPGLSTLTTPSGAQQKVLAVRTFDGSANMRDLTIDKVHTYYVLAGNTPLLVHNAGPCKDALKKFPDLSHLEGADPEEVLNAIPDHWNVSPLKKAPPGGGIRFTNPNAPGQSALFETGWPGHADPIHRGPYLRVSDGAGYQDRIPLAGNPGLILREMRNQGVVP